MSYSKDFVNDSKDLMQFIIELIDQLKMQYAKDVFTEKSLKVLCQSKSVLTVDHWFKVKKHVLLKLKEGQD